MRNEYYVTRTVSLHATNGVVHIEAEVDDWDGEGNLLQLEWNAQELYEDLPSLYDFCKKAMEERNQHYAKKYKELKKKL